MKYLRPFSLMMTCFMTAASVQAMLDGDGGSEIHRAPSTSLGASGSHRTEESAAIVVGRLIQCLAKDSHMDIPEEIRPTYTSLIELFSVSNSTDEDVDRVEALQTQLGAYYLEKDRLTPLMPTLDRLARDIASLDETGYPTNYGIATNYVEVLSRGIGISSDKNDSAKKDACGLIRIWLEEFGEDHYFKRVLKKYFPRHPLLNSYYIIVRRAKSSYN